MPPCCVASPLPASGGDSFPPGVFLALLSLRGDTSFWGKVASGFSCLDNSPAPVVARA